MKLSFRSLSLVSCMAFSLAVVPMAHADIFTATIYENIPDTGNAADLAGNTASSLASASFTIGASGINFQTMNSDATSVATFLNNPTFSNLQNGFNSTANFDNSEIVITGSTYLLSGANSFVVAHDDGVVVTFPGINVPGTGTGYGNVVDTPGPTSEQFTPFNVTAPSAGLYNFTIDYAECCGGPADLVFTVNNAPVTIAPSATPEPSSFVMLGTGLIAAAGMVRRRFAA